MRTTTETNVKIFTAFDGKRFLNEEDCKAHEGICNARIDAIVLDAVENMISCDNTIAEVLFKTEDDYNFFVNYMERHNGCENCFEKPSAFPYHTLCSYSDCWVCELDIGLVSDFMNNLAKMVNRFSN